jgi:hypothetical protein
MLMWSYLVTYHEYVEDAWLAYIHMRKLPAFNQAHDKITCLFNMYM